MLAGDWNSHPRWNGSQKLTHSSLVANLSTRGFESVYHSSTGHSHGSPEEEPTYLHQYKPSQPFHIDYIFLSKDLMARKPSFTLETFANSETRPSDHNALVLDFGAVLDNLP
jgi:endonuclease/exonuclease/phosphatase family metal-dependent hydrolase